jgi:hypothetical protein
VLVKSSPCQNPKRRLAQATAATTDHALEAQLYRVPLGYVEQATGVGDLPR